MSQPEWIDLASAEVDARRAAFLSHIADCERCRADLRREGPGDVLCPEVGRLIRAYDAAHELLAQVLPAELL